MLLLFRWLRLLLSYCLFAIIIICAGYYKTSVYLCLQAKGQFSILFQKESLAEFALRQDLSETEKYNISLVEKIKKYSVDSLAYLPTENFTEVYNQKNSPILWVITASEPYALNAYLWEFPMLGKVSYKGFFEKELATKEYNSLRAKGYDVDMRSVSAWSTLGWFNDPLLSGMLRRTKGSLCNLLFHELFHATYYKANSVDLNENLANFIAHKATLQFVADDKKTLKEYVDNYNDQIIFQQFMQRQTRQLKKHYQRIANSPAKFILKLKAIQQIADSTMKLPVSNSRKKDSWRKDMLEQKNAWFIDFQQYNSLQDSLEERFNKFYKGNLKKMVQDLKQD